MTPEAQRLLEYLTGAGYGAPDDPDPFVVRWLQALGGETARGRALLVRLRDSTIPARATDELGALSRWEATFGLPVNPPGVSVTQRRAQVVAAFRRRLVVSGVDWHDAITEAIGSANWTAEEHTPAANQLTITIPYQAGAYSAGLVEELIREATPANQEIVMRYGEGFIVGVSRVGDAI